VSDATPPSWFAQGFLYALGGFVTLLTAVFEYYRRKVDWLADTHKDFVTREELARLIENSEAESERKHKQNLDSMANLTGRIDRILERVK
jgi:hypothetical protein